jgi:uncharacterized repeat protein (TIGR03803 family)
VLEYVDLYIPHVAKGLNIRVGRFISIPGIEAQLAPNNYVYTHSLLYAVDPFTDTGILGTVKLNDHWLVQLGLTVSHDVAPWGTETVLHNFTGGTDGGQPLAGLIRDGAGNLYGTTLFGGIGGFEGVVFKLDRTGTETVLYSFTGGADGGNPYAPLIMDKKGNLYSTTNIGGDLNGCSGYGCGVVYKVTPSMTTRVD